MAPFPPPQLLEFPTAPTHTKRGSKTHTPPSSASTKVTIPFTGVLSFTLLISGPSQRGFWAETPPPPPLHLFSICQQTVSKTLRPLPPLPSSTPLARTPALDPQVISPGRDPFLPAPDLAGMYTHTHTHSRSHVPAGPSPRLPPQTVPPSSCPRHPGTPSSFAVTAPCFLSERPHLSLPPFLHRVPPSLPTQGP